jgi:hypothetical protein
MRLVSPHAPHDPTELDEEEAIRLQRIVDAAGLGAGSGAAPEHDGQEERCTSCRYYLNPGDALAYCWHPELRVLVGADWRCQHHDPAPEGVA